jgi:chaperone required for assembly of F1-ATPase
MTDTVKNAYWNWLPNHPKEREATKRLTWPEFHRRYPNAPCASSQVFHRAKKKLNAELLNRGVPEQLPLRPIPTPAATPIVVPSATSFLELAGLINQVKEVMRNLKVPSLTITIEK